MKEFEKKLLSAKKHVTGMHVNIHVQIAVNYCLKLHMRQILRDYTEINSSLSATPLQHWLGLLA